MKYQPIPPNTIALEAFTRIDALEGNLYYYILAKVPEYPQQRTLWKITRPLDFLPDDCEQIIEALDFYGIEHLLKNNTTINLSNYLVSKTLIKIFSSYHEQLTKAMTWLGEQENTYFVGQAVEYPGTGMSSTLENVPASKKLEFPVAENTQLGFCQGLALSGFVPISIFPRWNFLLSAMDQLVNHVDKLPLMGYTNKVIIRTAVGSEIPLHPQHQHVGNFSSAVRQMLRTVDVIELTKSENILLVYKEAFKSKKSTVLVEFGDYYNS